MSTEYDLWRALDWGQYQKAEDLARRIGLPKENTSERLRALVRSARLKGMPIASSHNGYKKTTSAVALSDTIQHMQKRVSGIQEVVEALVKAIGVHQSIAAWEDTAARFLEGVPEDEVPGD